MANWLKQKHRKKLKKVTVRAQPQINVELSHPIEGHEELVQSDHGENDGKVAEGTIPDESLNENEEGGAKEEAAAIASAIGLPEPDYDSAIESDCGSDDDF